MRARLGQHVITTATTTKSYIVVGGHHKLFQCLLLNDILFAFSLHLATNNPKIRQQPLPQITHKRNAPSSVGSKTIPRDIPPTPVFFETGRVCLRG
mmetsp:Transcript_16779/g.28629  ORF Transcript_16779/g.28629 Transcript_16779/m.28629 type:complete len:96 (+) Transcript_16779:215-502(+)